MTSPNLVWRGGGAIVGATFCTMLALAQSGPSSISPLRTAPTEKFTVNPGFRDWGPTTIAGNTILGGNSSNRGGLFAVDTLTGKVKWMFRPAGNMNPTVSTAPAVSGDTVITIVHDVLVAVSLATGKEMWRGPATKQSATVAVSSGLVYVLGDDGNFWLFTDLNARRIAP